MIRDHGIDYKGGLTLYEVELDLKELGIKKGENKRMDIDLQLPEYILSKADKGVSVMANTSGLDITVMIGGKGGWHDITNKDEKVKLALTGYRKNRVWLSIKANQEIKEGDKIYLLFIAEMTPLKIHYAILKREGYYILKEVHEGKVLKSTILAKVSPLYKGDYLAREMKEFRDMEAIGHEVRSGLDYSAAMKVYLAMKLSNSIDDAWVLEKAVRVIKSLPKEVIIYWAWRIAANEEEGIEMFKEIYDINEKAVVKEKFNIDI